MSIAKRIIMRREELGMKQQELAEESGLSQGSISQYERGTRAPTATALIRVAAVLKVGEEYLLHGRQEPSYIHDKFDVAIIDEIHQFSATEKQDVLEYAKFLSWNKERKKENDSNGLQP